MSQLDELIANYLTALEKGQSPDRESIIAEHPELRSELEEFFSSHDAIFQAIVPKDASAESPKPGEESSLGTAKNLDNEVGREQPETGAWNSDFSKEKTQDATSKPRFVGNYRILEEIDRGGMGIVYRAFDEKLQRVVALKMIRSGRLASESDIHRFTAEARAAAKLDHPGIVSVHDVGSHEGQPFFAMAFIEGQTLAHCAGEKPLSVEEACLLIKDIAEAIDHAHENGLVHRDLKPANILLDTSGRARITDFGLAKSLDHDSGITGTGEILGTINYMAPEQAAARNSEIDRTTDVYSLGAMLYFLCTGRPPFETDNPVDTLLHILDSEPTLANQINHKVPRDVARICQKCLEKNPNSRYETARELAAEIDRYLKGEPVQASKANIVSRFRRWSRREPVLVGHLVGLGLIESVRFVDYVYNILAKRQSAMDYLEYTGYLILWGLACVFLQLLQNKFAKLELTVKFSWALTDIGFLTLILFQVHGDVGPLYMAYPLVIVVSGFFWRVRMVSFTTGLCVLSFAIVFWGRPESSQLPDKESASTILANNTDQVADDPKRVSVSGTESGGSQLAFNEESTTNTHYGVVGIAAIIAIGYVTGLLVFRIRVLNRLFE